jgi:hypothetical protein
MREVAGSTPGLDFYLSCEPICVSLRYYIDPLAYSSCLWHAVSRDHE